MSLSSKTVDSLFRMGYVDAMEVQEKTIPLVLQGEDVIVESQTGSGKTAAFGVGLIENISKDKSKKALVLAPTRELAVQIAKELAGIASRHSLRIFCVYGGQSIEPQISSLRGGFDILIATPGRLLDHFERGTVRLNQVNCVVLDEADRMLDMGFREDIDLILSKTSKQRQTMLFSATISDEIKHIAANFMNTPQFVEAGPEGKVEAIKEEFIEVRRRDKIGKLRELLKRDHVTRMIVFVSTKRFTEFVCDKINQAGIRAECLHGDKSQSRRENVLRAFKEGKFSVLVATDVAARGIHVENVSHIVNYDPAGSEEMHTHRIGRTGRVGKSGKAITFVELDPIQRTHSSNFVNTRMQRARNPSQTPAPEHAVYRPKDWKPEG